MKNHNQVQEDHTPTLYRVEDESDAYTVYERQSGASFKVEKSRGKYVGPCSCGEALPNHQCPHQAAVRAWLMDRWWYGKGYHR